MDNTLEQSDGTKDKAMIQCGTMMALYEIGIAKGHCDGSFGHSVGRTWDCDANKQQCDGTTRHIIEKK